MKYDIDKGWKFYRGDNSVIPKNLSHDSVYGFSKAGGAAGPAALNFDDSTWEQVDLPHDWQYTQELDQSASANHGYRKGEKGWYRRKFCLDEEDRGKALRLEFDGIAGITNIYFNGSKLMHNESRYNSFSVQITDKADFGVVPNILAIEVDCTQWEGWWYEGSGIYRHVRLVKSPPVHVAYNGIWIHPKQKISDQNIWETAVDVTLKNDCAKDLEYAVSIRLLDQEGNEMSNCKSDKLHQYEEKTNKIIFTQENPILWDLENPYLYSLETTVSCNGYEEKIDTNFGCRTIQVDAQKGFFLNGKSVKLFGTCNHQDHAGVGAAVPDTVQKHRLKILKEMGCNAYRCAHHNPNPELLDFCDQMGILVMDENRAFNTSENSISLLKDMVLRDRNHPSIVMYSIFNEEPLQGTCKGRKLASHLMAELKKLDDSRPVLGAFNGGYMEEEGAATVFDITGINYFTDSYDEFHKKFPNQPIVSSELVSAFSTRDQYRNDIQVQVFDNYDHNIAPWGETVRDANRAVLERDYVMGMFVWTGFDYRGEPSPYEWPSVSSHFGTIDMCGYPKDAYYLYQAYWKNAPVLHLLPHWNHTPKELVKVMTYSNCEEIELFCNRKSLGRKWNQIYVQCTWEVIFEAGELLAVGYIKGKEVLRDSRITAQDAVHVNLKSMQDYAYADTLDGVILDITATDELGQVAVEEDSVVSVFVEGGKLLGMGNGDPNNHTPENTGRMPLFHGRCQAILRASEGKQMKAVVQSDSLTGNSYVWNVKRRKKLEEIPVVHTTIITDWRVSHTAQKEMQNPVQEMNKTDMNTLEPISFEGITQSQFDGKENCYCLYRTELQIGEAAEGRNIRLTKVSGEVTVYLQGIKVGEKNCPQPDAMEIAIPTEVNGKVLLSIIIKNVTVTGGAGVIDPVLLTTRWEC